MRNRNPQALADLSSTDKPTKQTTLQLAAFAVIILVIGIVGGIEQNRMPLLPGAAVMFILIALAGWLVHKSNDTEEGTPTTGYIEEDPSDILSGKVAEAYKLLSPEEQVKFRAAFAELCKKKAVSSAPTPKTASSPKTTKIHPHCKTQRGACQV